MTIPTRHPVTTPLTEAPPLSSPTPMLRPVHFDGQSTISQAEDAQETWTNMISWMSTKLMQLYDFLTTLLTQLFPSLLPTESNPVTPVPPPLQTNPGEPLSTTETISPREVREDGEATHLGASRENPLDRQSAPNIIITVPTEEIASSSRGPNEEYPIQIAPSIIPEPTIELLQAPLEERTNEAPPIIEAFPVEGEEFPVVEIQTTLLEEERSEAPQTIEAPRVEEGGISSDSEENEGGASEDFERNSSTLSTHSITDEEMRFMELDSRLQCPSSVSSENREEAREYYQSLPRHLKRYLAAFSRHHNRRGILLIAGMRQLRLDLDICANLLASQPHPEGLQTTIQPSRTHVQTPRVTLQLLEEILSLPTENETTVGVSREEGTDSTHPQQTVSALEEQELERALEQLIEQRRFSLELDLLNPVSQKQIAILFLYPERQSVFDQMEDIDEALFATTFDRIKNNLSNDVTEAIGTYYRLMSNSEE